MRSAQAGRWVGGRGLNEQSLWVFRKQIEGRSDSLDLVYHSKDRNILLEAVSQRQRWRLPVHKNHNFLRFDSQTTTIDTLRREKTGLPLSWEQHRSVLWIAYPSLYSSPTYPQPDPPHGIP